MNWQMEKQTFWDPYLGGFIEIQSPGQRGSGKGWIKKPVYYKGIIQEISVDPGGILVVTSETIATTEKVKAGNNNRTTPIKLNEITVQSLSAKVVVHGHTEPVFYGSGTVYLTEPSEAQKKQANNEESQPIVEPEPVIRKYKDKVWENDFRFLALLRHGPYYGLYNRENSLTSEGREKIKRVAEDLVELTADAQDKVIVLSSTSRRAFETALIIADRFSCDVERYKCIGDESGDYYDYEEVLSTISEIHSRSGGMIKYDTIIVVSHFPFCESAHDRIIRNLFGEICEPPRVRYAPGSGMLVDLSDFKHQTIGV